MPGRLSVPMVGVSAAIPDETGRDSLRLTARRRPGGQCPL